MRKEVKDMSYQKLYVADGVNKMAFNHEVNQRLRDGWRIQNTALWYDAEYDQPHYVAYLVKEETEDGIGIK